MTRLLSFLTSVKWTALNEISWMKVNLILHDTSRQKNNLEIDSVWESCVVLRVESCILPYISGCERRESCKPISINNPKKMNTKQIFKSNEFCKEFFVPTGLSVARVYNVWSFYLKNLHFNMKMDSTICCYCSSSGSKRQRKCYENGFCSRLRSKLRVGSGSFERLLRHTAATINYWNSCRLNQSSECNASYKIWCIADNVVKWTILVIFINQKASLQWKLFSNLKFKSKLECCQMMAMKYRYLIGLSFDKV